MPSEVLMWFQALLLAPYIAITSGVLLGITIAAICKSQAIRRIEFGFHE